MESSTQHNIPDDIVGGLASQDSTVRKKAASKVFRIIGSTEPSPLGYGDFAVELIQGGNSIAALGYVLAMLELGKDIDWGIVQQVYAYVDDERTISIDHKNAKFYSGVTTRIAQILDIGSRYDGFRGNAEFYLIAGHERLGIGDIDGAITSYAQMITLGDIRGYHEIIGLYEEHKRHEEAIVLCESAYRTTRNPVFLQYSIRFYVLLGKTDIAEQIYEKLRPILGKKIEPFIVYSDVISDDEELAQFMSLVDEHYSQGLNVPSQSIQRMELSALSYVQSRSESLVQRMNHARDIFGTKEDTDELREGYYSDITEYLPLLQFNVFVIGDSITPRYLVNELWNMYNSGTPGKQVLGDFFERYFPAKLENPYSHTSLETILVTYLLEVGKRMSPGFDFGTHRQIIDIVEILHSRITPEDAMDGYIFSDILLTHDPAREVSEGVPRLVLDSWNGFLAESKKKFGANFVARLLSYAHSDSADINQVERVLQADADIAVLFLFEQYLAGNTPVYAHDQWMDIIRRFHIDTIDVGTFILFSHFLVEHSPRCVIDIFCDTEDIFNESEAIAIVLYSFSTLSEAEQVTVLEKLHQLSVEYYGIDESPTGGDDSDEGEQPFFVLIRKLTEKILKDPHANKREQAFSDYATGICMMPMKEALVYLGHAHRGGYTVAIYDTIQSYIDMGDVDTAIGILKDSLVDNPILKGMMHVGIPYGAGSHEGAYLSVSPNLANKTLFTVLIKTLIQESRFDDALSYIHLGMGLYYNMTVHMLALLFYSGKMNESLEYYMVNKKNITDADFNNFIPGFFAEFSEYNEKVFLTDIEPDNLDLLEPQLLATGISATRGSIQTLPELYKNHWRTLYYLLKHDDTSRVYDFFIRIFPVLCQDDADAMRIYSQYNQDILDKSDTKRDKMMSGIVHTYVKKIFTLFVGWCNQIDLEKGMVESDYTKKFLIEKINDVIDLLEGIPDSAKYLKLWHIERGSLSLGCKEDVSTQKTLH